MSVSVVVGCAARLGLKLSWSQPVVFAHGVVGVLDGAVVVGDVEARRRGRLRRSSGLSRNGVGGLFEATAG